jgi:hypothetical protein
MFGMVFKLFAIAIGLVWLVFLAAQAFRNARRLDARIQSFKEEQETLEKRRGPIDPYAALAELTAEEEHKRPSKRPR